MNSTKINTMKRIIYSSTLLLLLVSVTSLTPSVKVKYSSSEAKLSITFPGDFETTEQFKESYKSVKTQAVVDGVIYFSIYTVHDNEMSDPEALAKVSLDAFNDGLDGEITEESTWKVNKQNGLQAMIKVPGQDLVGEYRVVILDQIQYQITVVAPEESWDAKKAKKFFKSFKVKK